MSVDRPLGKMAFTVNERIFNRIVHVLLNYDEAAFDDWAKRRGAEQEGRDSWLAANFDAFSSHLSGENSPTEWIICISKFNWTTRDQASLIHEITHTIIKIFAMNNIPFNFDTQEFLAHEIGNLYQDIADKILAVTKALAAASDL